MKLIENVPAGDAEIGDEVLVSRRLGWQTIVEIEGYPTLGIQDVECVVLCWESHRGASWENRAAAKNEQSTYKREQGRLRPLRLDEHVIIVRA